MTQAEKVDLILQKVEKLKFQIHAETSFKQLLLWAIILFLNDAIWLEVVAWLFIFGNVLTGFASIGKLGKGYFDYKKTLPEKDPE